MQRLESSFIKKVHNVLPAAFDAINLDELRLFDAINLDELHNGCSTIEKERKKIKICFCDCIKIRVRS